MKRASILFSMSRNLEVICAAVRLVAIAATKLQVGVLEKHSRIVPAGNAGHCDFDSFNSP